MTTDQSNPMRRAYFGAPIAEFLALEEDYVLGELARRHGHSLEQLQRNAWLGQIRHLKEVLEGWSAGHVLFEYAILRMPRATAAMMTANTI